MKREVVFYTTPTTPDGRYPVEEFLDSLNGKQVKKIAWTLSLIEELDVVPAQYFKKLRDTNELWEVLIDFGGDTFRILSFFDGGRVVVLAHGFQKKTRKTPRNLISLAEERKKDYFRRKANE